MFDFLKLENAIVTVDLLISKFVKSNINLHTYPNVLIKLAETEFEYIDDL